MTDNDDLIDREGNVDDDELDRRVRELGLDQTPSIDEARLEADKIDDDFDARLQALEDRARSQRLIRENKQREANRKQSQDRENARGLGVGLSIAYTIIGMPIAGLLAGMAIDGATGSQSYKGWGMLAGVVLGVAMTFVLLARANRQS